MAQSARRMDVRAPRGHPASRIGGDNYRDEHIVNVRQDLMLANTNQHVFEEHLPRTASSRTMNP